MVVMRVFKRITEKEEKGVIRKVGNKWRILKKNRKDYWDAEYDTKADGEREIAEFNKQFDINPILLVNIVLKF